MRFDQFTFKAQEAIQAAQKAADEMQHQAVDVEHLLLALVEQADGILLPLLQKVGTSPKQIAASLRQELGNLPKVYGPTQTYITPRLNEVFKRAQEEAGRLKDEFDNGRSYYGLHGQALVLPTEATARPAGAALAWHRDNVFLG